MSLKQFNMAYILMDDRILFRFNTADHSEFKLWLTRRITHFILRAIGELVERKYNQQPQSVEKMISESQQSAEQGANFVQPFESGLKYPLGVEAMLVVDVKCEMTTTEGEDMISLDLIFPGGGKINLNLPLPIMKNLLLMLEEQSIQAKWG